ncbi:MAG: hypothetical protein JJU25_11555 [Halomonas sp.]|nr:DUF1127 domain-containing protein [Halomonas sp.]MCC5883260.1 hypothetical protein [Halomonas sp.]
MAVLTTTRRLLRAICAHYANRRRDASLRDCDPRMLKDIGLRWERGKLVALHPERFANAKPMEAAADTVRNTSAAAAFADDSCPHCGSKLT